MAKELQVYNGKVFGVAVSGYGLEHGYLDYQALAGIVGDMILNNEIHYTSYLQDWETVNGQDYYENEDEEIEGYYDVYQEYIISKSGYKFLAKYTDEIVYYNNKLDVYLWGITHFGTAWSHVLTNIKLVEGSY